LIEEETAAVCMSWMKITILSWLISDVNEQKGIPDFWLNLLESQTFLPEQIQVLFIVEPTFFTLAFMW